jgi:DegV family protein with EDD domain
LTVQIVTDSTADLPLQIADDLGIKVVPLTVHFGTEVLHDGVDITPNEFYRRLELASVLPTTSQPTVGDFLNSYQESGASGAGIVSIHISGKLSGTLNSANQAKEQYTGPSQIVTVDSKLGSIALGLVAIAASEAASEGHATEKVAEIARETSNRTGFFVLLDTLEYLEKGGRIGKAQAFVGSLLRVKPILTAKDGAVHPLERARSRSKGIERLFDLVNENAPLARLGVVYSTTPDEANDLADRLKSLSPDGNVLLSQIGPVVGTHLGPGVIGVAFTTSTGPETPK